MSGGPTNYSANTTSGANWNTSVKINNLGLAATVGSNALTVALKQFDGTDPTTGSPVIIGFRNSTAATGQFSEISASAALSLVVSSGSTLATSSGIAANLYVYAINNAGTIELSISSSPSWDEGTLQNTIAEGGAGAADTGALYSTTARSNVAIRLIGRIGITEATAGTWATAPSEISVAPFFRPYISEIYLDAANGYGSTNTKIRKWTNVVVNLGPDMTLTQSATNGDSITINNGGMYYIDYKDNKAGGGYEFGVSKNSVALTTAIGSITYAGGRILYGGGGSDSRGETGRAVRLATSDIIRAHNDGTLDAATAALSHWIVTRIGD